ncbi:MAG: ABC transporter ATP-binding protein [Eubacteriales bacterium]|nr:ABC transporter ATP-binding protein [Eubacteriales bacterium]
MVIAILAAVLGTIFQIIGPNRIKEMTDVIMAGLGRMEGGQWLPGDIDMAAISRIGIGLAVLYGLSFLFSYAQNYIMVTVTMIISKKLRSDITGKIERLPLSYFDRTTAGDVLSRVTNDVDAISQTLYQGVGSLITSLTMLIGSLLMMFYHQWRLALTAVGSSVLGMVLLMWIMKHSQGYFVRQQQELGEINGLIEEAYSGHQIVRAYHASAAVSAQFEQLNDKLYTSAWKSQFFSGLMMPLMGFVGNLGYVTVCVVGAVLALDGQIGFGVIVAFMIYIRLFTQPLSQVAQAMTQLQRAEAAGSRVFSFLEEAEMADESEKTEELPPIRGEVTFEHVRFGYDPVQPVIRDFSARILPGQKIAIVGPTGAGKTTMVNLLMRFYETDSGRILIDGIPITAVKRDLIHAQFGMVLQDTWLFEGTIYENIVYNKEGVSREQVEAATRAVGLHHFIRTLPKGYDTALAEATGLSEGQKQLMTIARAMVQDAPLLILDEATSSVDTRTERMVQQAMDRLMQGRTSFVIAHRLSTIKNADLILVMKDGDIIESGSHEQLLAEAGFYSELYRSQFETVA